MKKILYFDHAATTAVKEEVLKEIDLEKEKIIVHLIKGLV